MNEPICEAVATDIKEARATDREPEFGFASGVSFRGWLPTVTGRLSFSVFGQTSHPTMASYANVSDARCRYVVISQERPTRDAIVPLLRIDTRFLYVFVASTMPHVSQEYLTGQAYIVDKNDWKLTREQIKVYEQCLQTARSEISAGTLQKLDVSIAQPQDRLLQFLNLHSAFSVDVRVSRTGTTDIKYIQPNMSIAGKPSFPTEPLKRTKMLRILCSQIFFFLKDVGHHHQHHDRHTDTITDLHPVTGLDRSNLEWRSSTLYNIYRKIIEYKRQPDQNIFYDCLGLLAYAKAFRQISIEELQPHLRSQLPVYYSEEVSQSIQATQSKNERATEERRYYEDRRTNVFIGCFGLLIAYVGLMQFADVPKITPNPFLIFSMSKLLKYPGPFLVLFLSFIYKDYLIKSVPSQLGIKVLRIFAPHKRLWPVLYFVLIILMCLTGIIALVRSFR